MPEKKNKNKLIDLINDLNIRVNRDVMNLRNFLINQILREMTRLEREEREREERRRILRQELLRIEREEERRRLEEFRRRRDRYTGNCFVILKKKKK